MTEEWGKRCKEEWEIKMSKLNKQIDEYQQSVAKEQDTGTLVSKYYNLPPEAGLGDFLDFFKIVKAGAAKYALNNWLEPDGKRCSEKEMHDSMFHHLASSFASDGWSGRYDRESGQDHLLHLACRALMLYIRRKRNIVHGDDK